MYLCLCVCVFVFVRLCICVFVFVFLCICEWTHKNTSRKLLKTQTQQGAAHPSKKMAQKDAENAHLKKEHEAEIARLKKEHEAEIARLKQKYESRGLFRSLYDTLLGKVRGCPVPTKP